MNPVPAKQIVTSIPDASIRRSMTLPLWPIDDPAATHDAGGMADAERSDDRKLPDGSPDRAIQNVTRPTISVHLPLRRDAKRAAVVVCPGGGYASVVIDKEGERVARRLNDIGIVAIVLKYRLPRGCLPADGGLPWPIRDVLRAIRTTRSRATEWNIDPQRIGVMGFSAGGHLAGSAATMSDGGDANAADEIERQSSRPDFTALIYPVASMHEPLVHRGSRLSLIGKSPDAVTVDRFSVDQHIALNTPPLFLVHAQDDVAVPVENSLRIAAAAQKAHVPCEVVLLENGGHGFGLGAEGSPQAVWFDRFAVWLRGRELLGGSESFCVRIEIEIASASIRLAPRIEAAARGQHADRL